MHRDDLNAKYKLKNGVQISIKTAMIGALAIFEEIFSEEIEANPEKWAEARTEILNKGHGCMDAAQNHFNRYNVTFKNFSQDSKGDYLNGKQRNFRTRR